MRCLSIPFILLAGLSGAAAQPMSEEAFGAHVARHFRDGPPAGAAAEVDLRVAALPTGELVALRVPVPATPDGWANSHVLVGCDDRPETKPWTAYRLTAGADFMHFDDTEAYETRQSPRFSILLNGCRLAEEAMPGETVTPQERNIALRNFHENLNPGPTFLCPDPAKCSGLARTVLAESAGAFRLGLADIALVQPYQVLRHAFPADRQKLRSESAAFSESVVRECGIPRRITAEDPHGNPEGTDRFAPCVAKAYERRRGVWLAAVAAAPAPGASEEARRPAEEHRFLQSLLKFHGYLPESTRIDGAYGDATRAAITAAQRDAGLPADGYMTEALAEHLRNKP